MICVSRSFVRKVVSSGALALLLTCAPMALAAQEKEAPAPRQVSVVEWFSSLWSDVTAWVTGGGGAGGKPAAATSDSDLGCAVDPHGGCGG
jgi:hypothetical protein